MAKLLAVMIVISFVPLILTAHVFADANTYPGYVAKKTTGKPQIPKLLSRLGSERDAHAHSSTQSISTSSPGSLACSFSTPFVVGGVAAGPGGQYVERWDTGDLWFYDSTTKVCQLLIPAPSGGSCSPGSNCGYFGLASKNNLVALISWGLQGLWTCSFCQVSNAPVPAAQSPFIPLPFNFCLSMPAGFCNPDGAAFDNNYNLWYVDIVNGVEVELTTASGYSAVGTVVSYDAPIVGIAIDPNTGIHWVVDYTCRGNVYENRFIVSAAGDALESIALSNLNPSQTTHIYVGVTAKCGNYLAAFVGDQSEFTILPSPFTTPSEIPGLSTQLYFSDSFGDVWSTTDTA